MVQLHKYLQPGHCGLAIGRSELFMQGGRFEQAADSLDKPAAAKLVRMAGGHADHREERCDERTAGQTVVRSRIVKIERADDRHDRLEVRRTFHGSLHLDHGEIADANHTRYCR